MTDQDQTTAPTNDTQHAAPAPQHDAAITPEIQAMIEAAKLSAYNAGAKAARVAEQSRQGRGPNATPPQPAAPQPTTPAVDYHAMRTFDRALGKFDLTDDAIAVIEEDFKNASPSDPSAWVSSRATAYGWRPRGAPTATSTTSPANPATATTTMANHTPVTSGGPPPPAPPVRDDLRIVDMSTTDRVAMANKLGPIEFSNRLRRELATVRVGPASTRR